MRSAHCMLQLTCLVSMLSIGLLDALIHSDSCLQHDVPVRAVDAHQENDGEGQASLFPALGLMSQSRITATMQLPGLMGSAVLALS